MRAGKTTHFNRRMNDFSPTRQQKMKAARGLQNFSAPVQQQTVGQKSPFEEEVVAALSAGVRGGPLHPAIDIGVPPPVI